MRRNPRQPHLRGCEGSSSGTLTTVSARRTIPPTAVDSLFLVGDVHREYDNLTRLLANAGIVDEDLRWQGGRAHLACVGDLVDRGPNATRVPGLGYRFKREAARAGGRVHVVLGNHEIMAIAADTVLVEDFTYTFVVDAGIKRVDVNGSRSFMYTISGRRAVGALPARFPVFMGLLLVFGGTKHICDI
jgi:hypothetical protein